MAYPITEELIHYNRSGEHLDPQGIVIHATATPGATDEREQDYFDGAYRAASAHYFADWDSITRCIPENEVAWHAGPTANHKYLSIEMCEPDGTDTAKFQEVWNRTVWFVADACVRYKWTTGPNVYSHRGISLMYPNETNHQDPIAYLGKYGKTWADLLAAIDAKIAELKSPQYSYLIINTSSQPLNIRSGPGTGYNVVGSAPKGAKVINLGASGGWYKINYNGVVGWVSGQYVKKV